jgi:hypothetical protein
MSNLFSSKPLAKPLKGGSVSSNFGVFDTVSANTLILDSISIAGVFEDGILLNVTIQDSEISNTIIGVGGPNAAYFTTLQTYRDVTHLSNIPGTSMTWNADTGELYISSSSGSFKVDGCSFLGNIEICRNDIKASNLNGDINIIPNGLGTLYLTGPISNYSSTGSFLSVLPQGQVKFLAGNDIILHSSHGSMLMTSFHDQSLTTINGDLLLNVDTGITRGNISNITFTTGNINISTMPSNHNLQVGDIVYFTSGSLNGGYTVGNVLSSTQFRLSSTTASVGTVTGGSFIKAPSNSIILNSKEYVKIPQDTKLAFGATCNSVYGNTSGIIIQTCEDVIFDIAQDQVARFPQSTKVQFGTSDSNYINHDGTSLNIQAGNTVKVTANTTEINSINTKFFDPILTIANNPLGVSSTDIKDRGVEFYYYDDIANTTKLGWFGYKKSTGKFTFITNATNTDEIITGSIGSLELTNLNLDNITLSTGGTINAACGRLLNVSLITGCSNNVTIAGSSNVTVTATNRINLAADTDILFPNNVPVKFGTSGSYIITGGTRGNLELYAQANMILQTMSRGSIIIPVETYISFDGSTTGSQRVYSTTTGDLVVSVGNRDIVMNASNIKLPALTQVHFGSSNENASGSTSGISVIAGSNASTLALTSNSNANIMSSYGNIVLTTGTGDINLFSTQGNVRILQERQLVFGATGVSNSISVTSQGTLLIKGATSNNMQIANVANLDLQATSNVNIPTDTKLRVGNSGEQYISTNSSRAMFIENASTSGSINILATHGSINVVSNRTSITTGTLTVEGQLTQINSNNLSIKDPIVTIGDYNLASTDTKDRGLEYRYRDAVGMKLGWLGRKDSTGRLAFYSDAINTDEVISGTMGDMEVSSMYLNKNLYFASAGNIDLSCGTISNVNTIIGCTGVVNINGSSAVNVNAGRIDLNASNRVQVPYNVPVSFGTTANRIVSDTAGNLTIASGKVIIDADIQVNGTSTTIYSTVTNIQDPILSIGGVVGPLTNDGKDRGLEVKWNNGSQSKTGFFGYKQNIGRFVFIRDGINTNEVFSGVYGDAQFGNGYFENLELSNGGISGVEEISGGRLEIKTTAGNISLTPTVGSNVMMPYNSKLAFGNTGNSISSDTGGNVIFASKDDITLMASTGSVNINSSESVRIVNDVPMYFGQDNNTYIKAEPNGMLNIVNSTGNINLTPQYSSGSVWIPEYNSIAFGSTRNSIYSTGDELMLNGYKGVSITSSTVNIAGNFNIIGTLTAGKTDFDLNRYILPLGTYQLLDISMIENTTVGSGNISIRTMQQGYLSVGDAVNIRGSGSLPSIDGDYTVSYVKDALTFNISAPGKTLTQNGTVGTAKTNLTTDQGKDVGIQVNYWSTAGTTNVTAGALGYKTGFFGFKENTERWSFYTNATIDNNVVTGNFGDIEVNKVNTAKMSGFVLEGAVSAGSNLVGGNNFQIAGGTINGTPIGGVVASTGRFTTLSNTVQAEFNDVKLQSTLAYSFERYEMSSAILPNNSPSSAVIVSLFSVAGTSFNCSGTMPSVGVADGTFKVLVCSAMGNGCTYTVHFGENKLITPNPLSTISTPSIPTKLVFKRRSQSAQVMYDNVQKAWILLTSGAYVI